ncbi:MAG: 50S ribosomal protein L10 [Candidatus Terrybacteria bacterium]|nr:50S ribosomal protein L10 [Candidatus Terrybacteria bacterium]
MLTREAKTTIVRELAEALRGDPGLFFVDYRSVASQSMRTLRERLRAHGGVLQVVKKTLLRRALADAGLAEPALPVWEGQTAVVYGFSDAAAAAKILRTFRKELEVSRGETAFSLRGGILGPQLLGPNDLETLALLPARPELLAQFAGVLAAPLSALAFVLASPVSGFVQVLRARTASQEEKGLS